MRYASQFQGYNLFFIYQEDFKAFGV